MKKQFLTFALLTTMVAGGATLSANADDVYELGGLEPVGECIQAPNPDCTAELGSPLYLNPGPGDQGDAIEPLDWSFVSF